MGQKEICACGSCPNRTEAVNVEEIVGSQIGVITPYHRNGAPIQQLCEDIEVASLGSFQRRGKDSAVVRHLSNEHTWQEHRTNDIGDTYGSASKLQYRSCLCEAHWNHEMGMAEVTVHKSKIWWNTGVVRSGNKLYCSIYEVLFLVEKGGLHLLDDSGTSISMEDIYMKISDENNRCSWEEFRAYRLLKDLGYVVGQHGIPWSTMGVKSTCEFVSSLGCPSSDKVADFESEDTSSAVGLFSEMQSKEARPVFNVYYPNNFKKSSPGDPSFVVCFTRSRPPSKVDLEALERQCGSIPLKFCHVDYGSLAFFSFDKVELPILP